MSISRADKGGFANWWFTVDKVALTTMGLLLSIGLMLAFAASPAITGGPVTAGDFHYAVRQLAFAAVALSIMAGASLLTLRQVKIVAALIFAGALIGSFLVLFLGSDVLGARRELNFGFMSLQPSEFLKPGFAILAAAVLSDRAPMAHSAGHCHPAAAAGRGAERSASVTVGRDVVLRRLAPLLGGLDGGGKCCAGRGGLCDFPSRPPPRCAISQFH
jgi:cell division protein FtsW (lipid II flippase)